MAKGVCAVYVILTANVLVGAGQWHKVEALGQASPGRDRAAFATLQRCDVSAELRVDHSDLHVLDDHAADVAHRLPGVVRDNHVGGNLLAVVVDLAV